MLEAGVSKSAILRTVACAWDLLEICPCAFGDNRLMAVTLIRIGVKLVWCKSAYRKIGLDILQQLVEKKSLVMLETRMVNALWTKPQVGIESPCEHFR